MTSKIEAPELDAALLTEEAVATPVEEQFICPKCGVSTHYRCRLCGATRTTNAVSGHIIWMLNGRVVAAFQDSREAWIRMATNYRIPRDEWPIEFRDAPEQTPNGDEDADF